jgi:amino acid transporter
VLLNINSLSGQECCFKTIPLPLSSKSLTFACYFGEVPASQGSDHPLSSWWMESSPVSQVRPAPTLLLAIALAYFFVDVGRNVEWQYNGALRTFSSGAVLPFLVAAGAYLFLALIVAELISRMPASGGVYSWFSRLVNPAFGWFVGWLGLSYAFLVAAEQSHKTARISELCGLEQVDLALMALIVFQCCLVAFGIRLLSWVCFFIFTVQLAGIIYVSLALLAACWNAANTKLLFDLHTFISMPMNIFLGKTASWFSVLCGVEVTAYLCQDGAQGSGKAADALSKAAIRVTLLMILAGFMYYAALILATANVSAATAAQDPVFFVISESLGLGAANFQMLLDDLASFGMGVAAIFVGSRLILAMADGGALPFAPLFARRNPKTGSPSWAVFLAALLVLSLRLVLMERPEVSSLIWHTLFVVPFIMYTLLCAVYWLKWRELPCCGDFSLGRLGRPIALVSIVLWCFMAVCSQLRYGFDVMSLVRHLPFLTVGYILAHFCVRLAQPRPA